MNANLARKIFLFLQEIMLRPTSHASVGIHSRSHVRMRREFPLTPETRLAVRL